VGYTQSGVRIFVLLVSVATRRLKHAGDRVTWLPKPRILSLNIATHLSGHPISAREKQPGSSSIDYNHFGSIHRKLKLSLNYLASHPSLHFLASKYRALQTTSFSFPLLIS
jgi:hypothetical protein